jgi:hypothetical protein
MRADERSDRPPQNIPTTWNRDNGHLVEGCVLGRSLAGMTQLRRCRCHQWVPRNSGDNPSDASRWCHRLEHHSTACAARCCPPVRTRADQVQHPARCFSQEAGETKGLPPHGSEQVGLQHHLYSRRACTYSTACLRREHPFAPPQQGTRRLIRAHQALEIRARVTR